MGFIPMRNHLRLSLKSNRDNTHGLQSFYLIAPSLSKLGSTSADLPNLAMLEEPDYPV
jgi:hypothetical protein